MADEEKQTILTAMRFLKSTFDQYATEDGDKSTLSKGELAKLLREQAGISEDLVPAYLAAMDQDGDTKLTFTECIDYLTEVTLLL